MDDDALTLNAFASLSSLASSDLITSVASAKGEPHAPRKTVAAQEEKVDARGAGRAVSEEEGPRHAHDARDEVVVVAALFATAQQEKTNARVAAATRKARST